jgi:hypothetical protein
LTGKCVQFESIKKSFQKFCSKNVDDLNALFTEVVDLKDLLRILNEKEEFMAKSVEDKWAVILTNKNLIFIRKLVSICLSIFSSNAYVESVFSIVNGLWSDEKNRFNPDTINAIVSIKCNSDLTCNQAYDLFLSNNDLLDRAKSSEKY